MADGAAVVRDVDLITPAKTMVGTPVTDLRTVSGYQAFSPLYPHTQITNTRITLGYQTREGFARFMAGFRGTTVKTIEDLIRFNLDHAAIELPPGASQASVPFPGKSKQRMVPNSGTLQNTRVKR